MKAEKEVDNARVGLEKLTDTGSDEQWLLRKRSTICKKSELKKLFAWMASGLKFETTLGGEHAVVMRRVMLMTAKRDSANARTHDVLTALRRIVKDRED